MTSTPDFGILPKLSTKYILSYVSQEDIFERFLNVKVVYDRLIKVPSAIRVDSHPTGGFKWSGNKLRFKDFAGHFWGDCFDAVAFIYGLNPNNSTHFGKVLDIVAREFKIHKYSLGQSDYGARPVPIPMITKEETPKTPNIITIEPRPFNNYDLKSYWGKLKIVDYDTLKEYKIYPTNRGFERSPDGNIKQYYQFSNGNYKDVCYTYYFEKVNDIYACKSYFPNRKQNRFRMNIPTLEGLDFFKSKNNYKLDFGIITKSYKDVVVANRLFDRLGINGRAVGLFAETQFLTQEQVNLLRSRARYLCFLTDFDFTGRNIAWKHKKVYGIPRFFFTNGTLGFKDYKAKDLSEYVERNDIGEAERLAENFCSYLISVNEADEIPF
jgi:hypothetical protein